MKLKSAVIGFAYLTGLICAFLLGAEPIYSLAYTCAAFAAGFFLLSLKKQSAGVFMLVFGIAFGVYALYRVTALDNALALDGETRTISGVVLDKTSPAHDMAGFVIEAEIDGTVTKFSLYGADTGAEVGDFVSFDAKFSLLRDNTAFAESSYYMSRGVFLKASALTTPVAEPQSGFSASRILRGYNQFLRGKILSAFPNDTGALICAVFLGDKSALSPALSQRITRAGIAHFTAVSGLHLTLIVHLFMSVFSLTRLRVMRRLKFVILTLFVLIFMIFFNLSPSVMRAGIMLIIFYGGELFMRRGNTLNSIGFAVLVLLFASPYACLDAGLLLSVAGTIGIGVVAPSINKRFTSPRFKPLREAAIGNLCATLTTLPFVAVFFGGASLVSPLVSMILLPFFTAVLFAMIIFGLTAGFDGISLLIAGIMSRSMEAIIDFFGGLKFAYIPLDYAFLVPWIAASAVFIALTALVFRKVSSGVKAACVCLFALSMMVISTEYLNLDQTRLDIYTDGVSACIFLRNRNHSVVIVTDDGARTARAARDFLSDNFLDEIGLLIVLNSTNNSLPLFAEIPALAFSGPGGEDAVYDVGGVFNVTHSGDQALITYRGKTISIAHIKTSASADIIITYNYSVNAGEFSGLVINTSRRADFGLNAYYDKVSFNL
jgi:ComEC/Rec2-related protein